MPAQNLLYTTTTSPVGELLLAGDDHSLKYIHFASHAFNPPTDWHPIDALPYPVVEQLTAYFAEVNPLDKAGAYAIQTRADLIVESFAGSRSNVIGLPLEDLGAWLTEVGITLE